MPTHRSRGRTILALAVIAALPLLGAAAPASAATATSTTCSGLQKLLGLCKTTTTTTRPTTTTTRPTTTTTTTTTPSAACGGVATLPKAGGGVWTCDFGDEFNGSSLNRALWL